MSSYRWEPLGLSHDGRTPDTSHAAAASVKNLRASQLAVLRVFERSGGSLVDYDLVFAYERHRAAHPDRFPRQSESGIRTRRRELADLGLLYAEGKYKLPTGRQARIWHLNDKGRAALERKD